MQDYQIRIELKTETLFGNGEAIAGFLNADVQTDQYGLPFLKAKTLKGLLRDNMELIQFNRKCDSDQVTRLFGNETREGIIRFSNAEFSEEVKSAIIKALDSNQVTKDEIKRAITTEFTYTTIENGVAKDHSLRTFRMLQKELVFYADAIIMDDMQMEEDEACLGTAVALLKHVGTLKSKGKGVVTCSLLKDGVPIQDACIKRLCKGAE